MVRKRRAVERKEKVSSGSAFRHVHTYIHIHMGEKWERNRRGREEGLYINGGSVCGIAAAGAAREPTKRVRRAVGR